MVLRVVFPRTPKLIRPDNVRIIARSGHTPFPRTGPGELVAILPTVTVEASPVVATAVAEAVAEVLEPEVEAPIEAVEVVAEVVLEAPVESVIEELVVEAPVAEPKVEAPLEVPAAEVSAEAPQWDATMKKADLVNAAEALGLVLPATATKAEILAALKAAEVVA